MEGYSSSSELRVVSPHIKTPKKRSESAQHQLGDLSEEYKDKVGDLERNHVQSEIDSIHKVKDMEADVQTQKMAGLAAAYDNLEGEYNRVATTSSGTPDGNKQSNGSVTSERDQLQRMHTAIAGHRVSNITVSSIETKPTNFLEWIFRDELHTVDKNLTTAEENEILPSTFRKFTFQ